MLSTVKGINMYLWINTIFFYLQLNFLENILERGRIAYNKKVLIDPKYFSWFSMKYLPNSFSQLLISVAYRKVSKHLHIFFICLLSQKIKNLYIVKQLLIQ